MVDGQADVRRGITEVTRAHAPPSRRIHVHVAGSTRIVADALARVLADERDIAVDGIGTSCDDLIERAVAEPDVVAVIDLTVLEQEDAAEAIGRLQRQAPDTLVVALRTGPTAAAGPAVVGAGAFRVVDGTEPAANLVHAVREAARSRTAAPPARGPARLSRRETEVVRLAATGRSNREIAEALYLSDHTVLGYLKSISTKLGVHSKLEAVVRAIAEGIIPVPSVDEIGARRR